MLFLTAEYFEMLSYIGIVIFLNSVVANADFNYNYEEYTDDGYALNGEDYVYNVTRRAKPNRLEVNSMENIIYDNVKTSPITTRSRSTRDCNFTKDDDAAPTLPSPDASDGIAVYPFAASVLKKGSHYASGALVDARWVLTSAGGFYNVRESIKLFRVRLGSVNCKRGGLLLPLQQITLHPGFTPGAPEYDLALIRLSEPVEHNPYIRPVILTEIKGRVENPKFLTLYWPRIIVNGKLLPESAKERIQHSNLRVSTQRLMSWEKCSEELSSRQVALTDHSFCLWPLKQHHTICMPDAGAPVVSQDGLWGIVSGWVGQPCTYTDQCPVVVTRVSPAAVYEWMDLQMEHD